MTTPNKTQHTPGPWFADGHYICSAEPDIYARQIAVTCDDGITGNSERIANARLIAAAPELLEALNGLFEQCSMIHKQWGDGDNTRAADAAIAAGRAAIARAEGRAE